jgi:hypothetical protein
MATFYPINTPLINYFFYKAPFITNGFSLTNYTISSGGTNYAVNDIIIFSNGIFTVPVVAIVQSVNAGAVQSLTITNNGNYSTTPSSLVQAYTSGIGSGLILTGLTFDSNYLQPPGPNIPLAGGFIYFYLDNNRTVQANSYSDVSNPNAPVVNPNPIQLGSSGECPLFYLDDTFYYIVITDNTGDQSNPVQVIEHYSPSEVLSATSAFNDNFIVNPQFNYPIEFYQLGNDPGTITDAETTVAWSWEFLQDAITDSENLVTFNNISGQQVEGNPINEIVLTCSVASSSETTKDFRAFLGTVDFYQGNFLTFCAQMQSQNGRTLTVELYLELNYGTGGSLSTLTLLTTFTIGITLKKYSFAFQMPSIVGNIVGPDNYSAIRIRPGIQQTCIFAMTNVMVVPGSQIEPIYVDESEGFSKAQILGDSTNISDAGLYENYSSYYYSDGQIFPYADTGTMVICPTGLLQNFRTVCDGTSRSISGYTTNNIPNQRLYDAIGTTFGASGDLIVTSSGNVVTFTSAVGAREKSPYTGGTTTFTVNNTLQGLQFGFDLVSASPNSVNGTFLNNFAPLQTPPTFGPNIFPAFTNSGSGVLTYWGTSNNAINPSNITIVTTNPGSGASQATFTLTFNSNIPQDYQTKMVANGTAPVQVSSFIDFAFFANNIRQNNPYNINGNIIFQLNGVNASPLGQFYSNGALRQAITTIAPPPHAAVVNFLSTVSMAQNIKTFIKTVANPFVWTVTVVSAPSAGQYFLYSSGTVDYYGWFKVNGVGTDPAIGGRTGVEIDTSTGQTTTEIAMLIADAVDNATFNVPSPGDLPAIPGGSPVSWFINL